VRLWRQVVVLTAGYSTLFYRFKAPGVKVTALPLPAADAAYVLHLHAAVGSITACTVRVRA